MDPKRVYDAWGPAAERLVVEILRGHGYVRGPQVQGLEEAFARRVETRAAVAVDSGTDALTLLLRAWFLRIGPGRREVILPAFTFVATASSVVNAGGVPVFADVEEETQNLDPASVAERLGPRTAAVIPVHLYGAPADVRGIRQVLQRAPEPVFLLEDAAQAVDAKLDGRPAGSLGDAAAFSFYPSKNLGAAGDGGMVTTSDTALADAVRALRDHGQTKKLYTHEMVGTNSRMDEIQAAVLLAKLPFLSEWTRERRAIAARYEEALEGTAARVQRRVEGAESAWHLFTVRVPERDRLRERLGEAGIATGVYYPVPLHRQPCFALAPALPCPRADRLCGEVLSLPCFPGLTRAEQDRVVEALRRAL
jgi:dTDP-4-amino-4,6-dideoxygalactose transaminase